MFDSNQDGYFDRWEYYWKEEILPYRIAELPDSVNRDLENEWSAIRDFYQKTIIPESIQWNEKLIQSLERGLGDNAPPVPDYLNKALQTDLSPAEKRYLLDWLREDRFRHFQREARIRAQKQLQSQPKQDPRLNSEFRKQSGRIWENAVLLSLVEKSYSLGEYGRVIEILDRMEQK